MLEIMIMKMFKWENETKKLVIAKHAHPEPLNVLLRFTLSFLFFLYHSRGRNHVQAYQPRETIC